MVSFYTDTASNGKLCHHDIADSPVDKPVTPAVTKSRGARHAYAHWELCIPHMIQRMIYATTLADSRSALRNRHIGGHQSICALAVGNRTLSLSSGSQYHDNYKANGGSCEHCRKRVHACSWTIAMAKSK